MRRLVVFSGLFFVLLLAVVGVTTFLPAAAAYVCPRCYGFEELVEGVWIERGAGAEARAALVEEIAEARRRVAGFYEEPAPDVVLLVCVSAACDRRLGGRGGKARAFGGVFILVSPDGRNATILAHEWSHVVTARKIGLGSALSGALPAWFNEGLAVVVARDPRYLEIALDGAPGCLVEPAGALPTNARDWLRAAGRGERQLYAMAACRVLSWMTRNGGARGVRALLERIGAGGEFGGG